MFMRAHYHALAMFTSRCHCALVQVGRRLCQRCRTCFSDGQLVPWRGAQRVKATDRVHREALNGSSQIRPAVLQHHLAMCGAPVRRNMLHLLRCTGRRGRRTRRFCCGVRQLLIRSSGASGPLVRCGQYGSRSLCCDAERHGKRIASPVPGAPAVAASNECMGPQDPGSDDCSKHASQADMGIGRPPGRHRLCWLRCAGISHDNQSPTCLQLRNQSQEARVHQGKLPGDNCIL
jgi:hypothetical protein